MVGGPVDRQAPATMHPIEIATALLVLIILLVIYRRFVTVLLPLITIGVSVMSAQGCGVPRLDSVRAWGVAADHPR